VPIRVLSWIVSGFQAPRTNTFHIFAFQLEYFRMKLKRWIKTLGFWGVLFFLVKGLLWLSIPALIALFAD
jgi:hypothetical protein